MIKSKLSRIHFPTALGLLILLIAISMAVFLIRTRTGVKSEVQETATPKQVRITNVTDSSFSVSWVTDKNVTGLIKLGTEPTEIKQQALDDRDQLSGESGQFDVHHVTAKNLTSNTKYYFKIESAGKQFDNNAKPFEATTGTTLGTSPVADPVYGTILNASGTAAEGVIVYVNVANGTPLSALSKTNGNWALSLSTARTADLSGFLSYDAQATIANLLVQGGKAGTASAITMTSNDSPVPDITLGKSHDFRLAASSPGTTPTGFSLEPLTDTPATESGEVTLENPSFNGEVINATQPAFIGSGPPGTVLAIEINSPSTYTGSATIGEEGEWEFVPSQGLTPGEHTVTISYIDSTGIEQSLSRSFVIAAAGDTDVPAITATISGGATDSGRIGLPATDSGVPEAGTGELTLLMLLTGLGLLMSGMILKVKNLWF